MIQHGANPYDAATLRAWQIGLGYPITAATLYFHYLPASLPLFGVLLLGNYPTAVSSWFVVNGGLLLLGGYFTWLAYDREGLKPIVCFLVTLIFLPRVGSSFFLRARLLARLS